MDLIDSILILKYFFSYSSQVQSLLQLFYWALIRARLGSKTMNYAKINDPGPYKY